MEVLPSSKFGRLVTTKSETVLQPVRADATKARRPRRRKFTAGRLGIAPPFVEPGDLHLREFAFRGGIDISSAVTGAAQPQITRTNLSPLLIRYPKSVTEQTRLAEKFEDLTEETQRLARLSERKLVLLEALKKSLLHQAFTGQL